MAVFWTALLGFIGIAATFFAPPWAQRQIERRREQRLFRRAQRTVAVELDGVYNVFSIAVRSERITERDLTEWAGLLPTSAWEANETILAEALSESDWRAVAQAYRGCAAVKNFLTIQPDPDSEVHERVVEALEKAKEAAVIARDKLTAATPVKD